MRAEKILLLVIFIIVLSSVSYAGGEGLALSNPKGGIIINSITTGTTFSTMFFSITGLQANYNQGSRVDVTTSQSLFKDCSGEALFLAEVYNVPSNQQLGKQPIFSQSQSLGTNIKAGTADAIRTAGFTFFLPSSTPSGTWSISTYIYCPAYEDIFDNADKYSTINEKNFGVIGTGTATTIGVTTIIAPGQDFFIKDVKTAYQLYNQPNFQMAGADIPVIVTVGYDIGLLDKLSLNRKNMEIAIYSSDAAPKLGIFTAFGQKGIELTSRCNPSEEFVTAVEFDKQELDKDKNEAIFTIPVTTPKSTSLLANGASNWNGYNKSYTIVAGIYNNCGEGYESFKTTQVTLTQQANIFVFDGDGKTELDCAQPITLKTPLEKSLVAQIFIDIFGLSTPQPFCGKPRTKEEFTRATDNDVLASLCYGANNCEPRTNHTVSCVNELTAGVKIPEAGFQKIAEFVDELIFQPNDKGLCLAEPIETGFFNRVLFTIGGFAVTGTIFTIGLILIIFFIIILGRK